MSCVIKNTLKEIQNDSSSYIKSLVLNGNLPNITIQQLAIHRGLIYIDTSSCGVFDVIIFETIALFQLNILFADFNQNRLHVFLSTKPFSHVLYVDLSRNLISYISSRTIQMQYSKILRISSNPLKEIYIKLSSPCICV